MTLTPVPTPLVFFLYFFSCGRERSSNCIVEEAYHRITSFFLRDLKGEGGVTFMAGLAYVEASKAL